MRRRALLRCTAAACIAAPAAFAAAQPRVRRVGELNPFPPDDAQQLANAAIYTQAFIARGWQLDKNLVYVKRIGPRTADGWNEAARELAAAEVELIVTYTDAQTAAALRATRTIPIVAISGAPVELGLVQSLARPGGNLTGVSFQAHDENGRALSLLREMRPGLARIGVPVMRASPVWAAWFDSIVAAAQPPGLRIVALPAATSPAELAPMLDAAKAERIEALTMPILPFLNSAVWQQISAWAVEQRVVTRGSLLSRGDAVLAFGSNVPALLRLHVEQIDRVLRGAKPAETPFVQPTLWDTVINQKLARAVGWPAPPAVLLQATEVIE
jgi:putative ABC transport system substrate-binding protein